MAASQSPAPEPPEPPELNQTIELLRFIREENAANRTTLHTEAEANRKLLADALKMTSAVLAILIAAVAFFGIKSINDVKEAIESEARRETQAEITRMQGEIRTRLGQQFESQRLKEIVKEAAEDATKKQADPLIRTEVATQVKASVNAERGMIANAVTQQTKAAVRQMQPQINSLVKNSVDATVEEQVKPVTQRLDALKNSTELQRLILRMNTGDAVAFDQAVALSNQTQDSETKNLLNGAIEDVIEQRESLLRIARHFTVPLTDQEIVQELSDPNPMSRVTALDVLADKPQLLTLPKLVEIATTDNSLLVRCTAARIVDARSKQTFLCVDKFSILRWWQKSGEKESGQK